MHADIRVEGSASGLVVQGRCWHFEIVESGVSLARLTEIGNEFALKHATCPMRLAPGVIATYRIQSY